MGKERDASRGSPLLGVETLSRRCRDAVETLLRRAGAITPKVRAYGACAPTRPQPRPEGSGKREWVRTAQSKKEKGGPADCSD